MYDNQTPCCRAAAHMHSVEGHGADVLECRQQPLLVVLSSVWYLKKTTTRKLRISTVCLVPDPDPVYGYLLRQHSPSFCTSLIGCSSLLLLLLLLLLHSFLLLHLLFRLLLRLLYIHLIPCPLAGLCHPLGGRACCTACCGGGWADVRQTHVHAGPLRQRVPWALTSVCLIPRTHLRSAL